MVFATWSFSHSSAQDAEIHTFHCLHGCPVGSPETNDLVVREIYTLSSNDLTRFADWVAYRVTPETIGPTRNRSWRADPWLDPDETLEPSDYNGAPSALGIDRGHQAPLAAFTGTVFWRDTNILSNITPQSTDLNQGPWLRLEDAERDLVIESGATLYVLTGPLFEQDMRAMPRADEPHRVPSGYWKVLVMENYRASAFIMNQTTTRSAPYCWSRVSLEDVESRTGLRLFPRLSRRNLRSLDRELGC
ncbi:DNA/RNA non-specific endonuclease [Sphingosinicella sp. CPCC 101087]|uniref:DNA/RNA non-specific endonuclease n=1 Tax=Sphingosinicella sp. CPCC 101087 TaxID=2497754 RepID=UPI00197DB999|nr:DNA/RNA non-specific endonuclease [Sphingosinicella sp. CPCC 101087]